MNRVKKIWAGIIVVAMILTLGVPVLAASDAEDGALMVLNVGHGEFKIDSTALSRSGQRSEDLVCLSPVSDRNGFYEDSEGTVYLKCTETSLLQVDEVPVNIGSSEEVNQIIEEYGLSDIMAEDLHKLCADASELGKADSNSRYPKVVLYTARTPLSDTYSTNPKEPRYYSYGGHNLKDDVLYTVYITPFQKKNFEGRTTSDNLKDITDVTLYVVGAVSEKLVTVALIGSGISLAYGILQGWINEFGERNLNAKNGDWAQFSIDYNSNTKYTSVENVQGNYPTCAKTGDVFVNRHGVITYINGFLHEEWYDINKYAYTPNYPNTAPKAIASATGGLWIEEIEYRTSGGYFFCPNNV